MASDISNIINNEFKNTFESLLSISSSIEGVKLASKSEIDTEQSIVVVVAMDSKSGVKSEITYYLPTLISTKFEYFMLGGIGELKASIDDEILDAAKEIISTISGSLSTTINAQDFTDLKGVSFSQKDASIKQITSLPELNNLYRFDFNFNKDLVSLFLQFDKNLLPFVEKIVNGEEIIDEEEEDELPTKGKNSPAPKGAAASVLALLGDESTENLKLLFGVKLRFSVRLGLKTFLLKDIVNWDVGHIIELEQMVNEPLDILINGVKVGEGEAVIVEGRFGVKIKNIGEKKLEL
ncbi:MAG: FliM/FliN family flagellar motor switch protein [Arcobacteraceae bacterium]|nr:FliM/FliN family flagellar motor switch protein [Arcobacteraceae bacterium]